MNNPRNIGIVKVAADDFTNVMSEGIDSSGGFYGFHGGWSLQENKGIIQVRVTQQLLLLHSYHEHLRLTHADFNPRLTSPFATLQLVDSIYVGRWTQRVVKY